MIVSQHLYFYHHHVLQQLDRLAHLSVGLVCQCESVLRRQSIGVLFHQHIRFHRHHVLLQCVMIVDFGTSVLLEISDFSPSLRHHVSSGQQGKRRVVQVDVRLSSSYGVRKTRKTRYRRRDLKFLLGERRCELAAVEMEVRRWLPASADNALPQ